MKNRNIWLAIVGFSGMLGVALGAFGAHGMEGLYDDRMMDAFETGVRYQMYHTLALLGVLVAAQQLPGRAPLVSRWCFLIGILLFSGSLYMMVFSGISAIGIITPIGGVAFIVGWASLTIGALSSGES